MSKPLFRSYDSTNRKKKQPESQKEKYQRLGGIYETPRNTTLLNPESRSQRRRNNKRKKALANAFSDRQERIKLCIAKREQNKQEEKELLTTRQKEVKEDLARRGLLDENGNVMLDQIDTNTGCRKGYTPPPKENVVKVNLSNAYYEMDNSPAIFQGQLIHQLNMQIHHENEIYDTIIKEGQAIMHIDPLYEIKGTEYAPLPERKSIVYPREDFVYHKPLPPVKAITFNSPYQDKGRPAIIITGHQIPWSTKNKAQSVLDLRKLVFYRECRMNPDIIWITPTGRFLYTND